MDVHSKASLIDQNSPAALIDQGRDDASSTNKLTEDVVIVVDNEDDLDNVNVEDTKDGKLIARRKTTATEDDVIVVTSSLADRSSESLESSSLATSTSEQPHQQHRRKISNLYLAHSLPSTALSSSMTGGSFSGVAASSTAGGSLEHVSGVRKRKSMSGCGSRSGVGSNRNSSESDRVRPKYPASNVMDEGVQAVGGGKMQGCVRRTRSALETTRGTRDSIAAVELVAGDCDSLNEEITSKSPLLVQRELPHEDCIPHRKENQDSDSPTHLISLPGMNC